MLLEPAFFIVMGALSMLTQNSSFHSIYSHAALDSYLTLMVVIVTVYLLVQIALVENSRVPVDDPTTHLELTMVHEVMVLDNSGFDLALIQMGTWLKFALYGALMANFLIPAQWSFAGQAAVFIATQIAFASTIGFLESFRPRNKMVRNPQWILTLSAISMIVFLGALIIAHKYIIT
jgi:formate hydrogenlyase subunit 4